MDTKNLGLVKAIFYQSGAPTRIDVLWYDTINSLLKVYDPNAGQWQPINHPQLSGTLTDGAPTAAEISSIVGLTAAQAGSGYKVSIKDTTGTGLLYRIESNGSDWCFVAYTVAI